MSAWAVKDATKSWETVFDRAWAGEPQFVTRGGEQTVVVVSLQSYEGGRRSERSCQREQNLLEVLRSCPCGDDLAAAIDDRGDSVSSYFERNGGFAK